MTHEDTERHEDLQRLFDRTASAASGPTLTKLAARAADVPRLARRSRVLPRWAWGPLFAGAACALGGLLALHSGRRAPLVEVSSAKANAARPASIAVASASGGELVTSAPHAPVSEDSDNLELLGDADEGARFEVTGPQSDRDLDAWLAATKDLSGGT